MTNMREHIKQSNLIENVDDPLEVVQSLKAWRYLQNKNELSEEIILKTHYLIMERIWPQIAGQFRTVGVQVGNRLCPPHTEVRALLDLWMSQFTTMTPQQAHVEFEHIHPFRDGNGRTGRMLMWWHEKRIGLEPTLIEYEKRFSYYRWF